MYAIVTAGGIPKPKDPLYEYTQGKSKSLLDVQGKPMIQWVLDALSQSQHIQDVIIIGLGPESGVTCAKPLHFCPNQGSMLQNILFGVGEVLKMDPSAHHALIASSDVPAVTGEMVDWIVQNALKTDDDVYYHVVPQAIMEKRYPNSHRTYTHLKGLDVCGGDINVVRTMSVKDKEVILGEIIESRKNPFKQASIVGFDLLLLLLLRQVTLEGAVERISRRLGIKGRGVICPYAEVGMDVDKPHQLEMMRADLAKMSHT